MIDVQNLTKRYADAVAVNDATFRVAEGETLVLLGTSGSGKTTMLRMINRLVEPTSGSIRINGEDIFTQPPALLRRRIGYVLQGYGLFPHYTVAENVAIVPALLGWTAKKINDRVDSLLHKVQMPPAQYRNAYPANLSGGQMQRVGLARALAADPPILLMDEPFGALDPLTRIAVRQEFKSLDELVKKTIVLVTHDVEEAFALGDQIGLMDKGILQQFGTPAQLLFSPANGFVKNFFQHQRTQLEWQSLSLKAVWPYLRDAPGSGSATLTTAQSGWDAMALLSGSALPVALHDEESGAVRQLDFAHLQAALHQQKQPG